MRRLLSVDRPITGLILTISLCAVCSGAANSAPGTVPGTENTGVRDVVISGSYAYCVGRAGVFVLDAVDPANPTWLSEVGLAGAVYSDLQIYRLDIQGSYLYVGFGDGLHIVNVSNPAAPFVESFHQTVDRARGAKISGSYAYVTPDWHTLEIINVERPDSPYTVSVVDYPGRSHDAFLRDGYAFVVGGEFDIIDVHAPDAPFLVGECTDPLVPTTVELEGNYAYLGVGYLGFMVIDISDLSNPFLAGQLEFADSDIWECTIIGRYAYVAAIGPTLWIIDVSDPSSPFVYTEVPLSGRPYGIARNGSHLYVAGYDGGVQVVDLVEHGDVNADGVVNTSDIIALVNYLFKSGTSPEPADAGDADCDRSTTAADIIYLVNYAFKGGDPPYCP